MLSVEKNKDVRRKKLIAFTQNTQNYQVANIDDVILGQKILDHYHKKFHANLNRGADTSILFMMINDEFWFIEETGGTLTMEEKCQIVKRFGSNLNSIPVFPTPKAKLEVRIQPRHIKKPSTPVSIDVMANFRLSGRKPTGGVKV